jgi:hypothetical protein
MSYEQIPHSAKIRCTDCGRSGYDQKGRGWQAACERGHAPCPDCGHLNALNSEHLPRRCVGNGAVRRHKPGQDALFTP